MFMDDLQFYTIYVRMLVHTIKIKVYFPIKKMKSVVMQKFMIYINTYK
jgi:hypothetical protein